MFYFLLLYIRAQQQKTFIMLSRFWLLSGGGRVGWGESVKKGKSGTKIFFQKMQWTIPSWMEYQPKLNEKHTISLFTKYVFQIKFCIEICKKPPAKLVLYFLLLFYISFYIISADRYHFSQLFRTSSFNII